MLGTAKMLLPVRRAHPMSPLPLLLAAAGSCAPCASPRCAHNRRLRAALPGAGRAGTGRPFSPCRNYRRQSMLRPQSPPMPGLHPTEADCRARRLPERRDLAVGLRRRAVQAGPPPPLAASSPGPAASPAAGTAAGSAASAAAPLLPRCCRPCCRSCRCARCRTAVPP